MQQVINTNIISRVTVKLVLMLVITCPALSQNVAINNDGSVASSSAALDIKSTDKGLLIPRMTTAQRNAISAPATGLMVFDNSTGSFWFYTGTTWSQLSGGGPSSEWATSGANIYNTNTGNVGIGLTNPTYKLHISKSSPNIGLFDAGKNHFSGSITGDSTNLIISAYKKLVGGNNESGNLILQQSTSGFPGSVAGNVGIGVDDPAEKLAINGSVGLFNGSTLYGRISNNTGDFLINAKTGVFQGSQPNHLILQYSSGLPVLAGNIGIGILNPQAKLHIGSNVMIGTGNPASGYALSVNGKIISEELKVQLKANWPDYVFSKNYNLKPLDELRSFIELNNHLPNIPPASFMEKNGIEVGEMQRKVVEKIEELTLYILQLEKEIKELKLKMNRS